MSSEKEFFNESDDCIDLKNKWLQQSTVVKNK